MPARLIALTTVVSLALAAPAVAAEPLPADPLDSVMWEDMAEKFFADGAIVFDQRVVVKVPREAEDQMQVPVTVDARGLFGVREIVVIADLNPIHHVLTYRPGQAEPFIGFRMKVEQATPIRAAVKTVDGTWHLGGALVDAAGGGCTAPANAHATSNWMKTLGQTRAMARRTDETAARLRIRMRHPMDTGLADGIPAFFLQELNISPVGGAGVSRLELHEPVSENPTITVMPRVAPGATRVALAARDNEGNTFAYEVAVPAAPISH